MSISKPSSHQKIEKEYRNLHQNETFSDASKEFLLLNPYPDTHADVSEALCAKALILTTLYYFLTFEESEKHTRKEMINFIANAPSCFVELNTINFNVPNDTETKIQFLKFYKIFNLFPEDLRNKVKGSLCMHYILLEG